MIKVKITKNIIRKSKSTIGLDGKQIAFGVAGFGTGILLFFLLEDKMPLQPLLTLVFIVIAVTVLFGVVNIQGMNMFQYIIKMFKGVEVRPYDSKGVFSSDIHKEKK